MESFSEKTELKVWYELLTLGFVKVTRGYVKKAGLKTQSNLCFVLDDPEKTSCGFKILREDQQFTFSLS